MFGREFIACDCGADPNWIVSGLHSLFAVAEAVCILSGSERVYVPIDAAYDLHCGHFHFDVH